MSNIPDITATGEYVATRVELNKDGSSLRIAFGRNGNNGPVYLGAAILTAEAIAELKEKLTLLGV